MSQLHVGIVGAGAWGTALALASVRAGCPVTLWGRNAERAAALQASRRHPALPAVTLPPEIAVTADLAELFSCQALILAVPTQALGQACLQLAAGVPPGLPLIAAAKGIERGSARFVTEVLAAALPAGVPALLSGPGFAADVAQGSPTAETLACADPGLGARLAAALGSPTFRIYHSTDVRGVELGGAAKNVLAIAAGIAAGKGFGESAVAALIARGFAELVRLGMALGARPDTLAGLSGLGDLILTGTSRQSRNRRLGEALGRGLSAESAIAEVGLAEGAWTAEALVALANRHAVEMPVSRAVTELVAGRLDVDRAIAELLARPLRAEGG